MLQKDLVFEGDDDNGGVDGADLGDATSLVGIGADIVVAVVFTDVESLVVVESVGTVVVVVVAAW